MREFRGGRETTTGGALGGDGRTRQVSGGRSLLGRCGSACKGGLSSMFLPEGFPGSVAPDYLPYQIWDTCQAFCSTVTGMLAAKAMLTGMGVGNETASVGAALWQSTVRRNIGKVARIFFVTFRSADLDDNAKSWRIVADVLNDLALAIELLSPALCPASGDCNAHWSYFAAVSAAETFRAVVGVAGGATRAALTQHFALRDNYGDLTAKDGSQEVFVEILGRWRKRALLKSPLTLQVPQKSSTKEPYYLGSSVGLVLVQACESKSAAWLVFLILTACHIAANVMACRAVCLATFNRQRAQIVARAWAQVYTKKRGRV